MNSEFGIIQDLTHRHFKEDDGYKSIEIREVGATGKNVMLLRRLHCTHP